MSTQMRRLLAAAGAAAMAAVAGGILAQPISAAQHTANLAVSASVTTNCRVAAGSIDFGSYDPIDTHDTTPLDAAGSFQVRCTRGGSAVLKLDQGGHASGGTRRMSDGGGTFLAYDLYTSGAYTTVWDDTANTVAFGPAATSALTTIDVFGRVPAGQDVPAGAYADTVTITAEF